MYTEEYVFDLYWRTAGLAIGRFMIVEIGGGPHQENYVATVDVVLPVSAIALESGLVHGEIRSISIFGVVRSQDAGSRCCTLVWRGGSRPVGKRSWPEQLRLLRVRRTRVCGGERWRAEDVGHGGGGWR